MRSIAMVSRVYSSAWVLRSQRQAVWSRGPSVELVLDLAYSYRASLISGLYHYPRTLLGKRKPKAATPTAAYCRDGSMKLEALLLGCSADESMGAAICSSNNCFGTCADFIGRHKSEPNDLGTWPARAHAVCCCSRVNSSP